MNELEEPLSAGSWKVSSPGSPGAGRFYQVRLVDKRTQTKEERLEAI